MENRERDQVSKSTGPTDAGEVNRHTSEQQAHDKSADFGQSIGRAEELNSPTGRSGGSGTGSATGTGSAKNATHGDTGDSTSGRH